MNNDKFELHPWQVEALKEVREKLGEDTARWAGGVVPNLPRGGYFRAAYEGLWNADAEPFAQLYGRGGKTKSVEDLIRERTTKGGKVVFAPQSTMFSAQAARSAHHMREVTEARRRDASCVIWDEVCYKYELPFIDKPIPRVWDARGFTPQVLISKRHPDLLVAADWRRANTFDLYSMAIHCWNEWFARRTITQILAVKCWVSYMDDVQHAKFDDITPPMAEYDKARGFSSVRDLFKADIGLSYVRLALIRAMYPA